MTETQAAGGAMQSSVPSSAPSLGATATIATCFLVALLDGYDTLMLSFIAPLIAKQWQLAPSELGKIFSSGFAGAVIGAIVVGAAADRFGRKAMLVLALSVAGLATLACAAADGPGRLMLIRLVAGIGLGGAIPAISALSAGHASADTRSTTVTRMFLGFPIGAVAGGAITAAVMTEVGWRGIFVGAGTLTLLLAAIVPFMVTEASVPKLGRPASGTAALRDLVADGRGVGTAVLCAAAFLMLLVSYFLVSWTPTLLTLHDVAPKEAALAGVAINLGGVIGAFALSFYIVGRRPFIPVAILLGFGALLILTMGVTPFTGSAAALGLALATGLGVIGAQLNIPALCVEFYPAGVRATGVGLSMAAGRVGSIVGPLIGGYLIAAKFGWPALFSIAAVPAAVAAIALAVLGISQRLKSQP